MTLTNNAEEEMKMVITDHLSKYPEIIISDFMKRIIENDYEIVIIIGEVFRFSSEFGQHAESNGYFKKYEEEIALYCSYYEDYGTEPYRNDIDFTNNKAARFNYFANVYSIVNDIIIKDIITDLYNNKDSYSYVVLK